MNGDSKPRKRRAPPAASAGTGAGKDALNAAEQLARRSANADDDADDLDVFGDEDADELDVFGDEDADDEPDDDPPGDADDGCAGADRKLKQWLDKMRGDDGRPVQIDDAIANDGAGSGVPRPLSGGGATAVIVISNHVLQARCNMPIDWRFAVPRGAQYGLMFRTKNFGAIDMQHLNPKVTTRVYSSGRIGCSGAREATDAIMAIELTLDVFRSMRDHMNIAPYRSLRCVSVRLVNLVGDIDLPFRVSLPRLASYQFVKYNPQEWSTANIRLCEMAPERYGERKAIALVSAAGRVNISGARSRQDLARIYADVLPVLQACADTEPRPLLDGGVTEDQQRRAEAKRQRTAALPASSRAYITVAAPLPAEAAGTRSAIAAAAAATPALPVAGARPDQLMRINGAGTLVAPGSGGGGALAVTAVRRSMPDGTEMARNMVALRTMAERRSDAKAALMAELDAEVNVRTGKRLPGKTKMLSREQTALLSMAIVDDE